MRLVEKFGLENNIKLHAISNAELAEIMRVAGGLKATDGQAGIIQGRINTLDSSIQSWYANETKVTSSHIQGLSGFSGMPQKEAEKLAALINNRSKDPTPQTFLAAGIAKNQNIPFIVIEYLKELKKLASRPSLPTSPTSISLNRIFHRATKIQKLRLPKTSGDYFSDAYMSLDYNYTEFKDESIGNSGQIHDWAIGLHGTIFENTDLSFGLIANEAEANGSIANDFRSETFGFDSMIHHNFNDNYGVGVYGFYQHSKYEKLDTRDYGAGYGFLFSTWHDFDSIELSTVTSWTKTYYEAGNDTLFNGTIEVTRYWTDRFSTSLRASYTDSLDDDVDGDNSYWSLGGSIGYMINDDWHVSLSYTTDEAIKEYESETWGVSLSYYF